jgi:hypothetical protein
MNNRTARPQGERGSAYIVVLLALVVLTILALTLTLVTQSEVQIGGAEKTINRNFYASESALAAVPELIFRPDKEDPCDSIIINRTHIGTGTLSANLADRITIGPPPALDMFHADLSMAAISKQTYYQVVQVAVARADRIRWNGDGLPPVTATVEGTKTIVEYIAAQPIEQPKVLAFPTLINNACAPTPPS